MTYQKLQNLVVCHPPCCPWMGCVLSPTPPEHSACLLLLLGSLPDWCWTAWVTSSTILLLCFPCASLSRAPPAQFSFVHAVGVAGRRAIFTCREWVGAGGAASFWMFDLPRSAGDVLSETVLQGRAQESPPLSCSTSPCGSSPA